MPDRLTVGADEPVADLARAVLATLAQTYRRMDGDESAPFAHLISGGPQWASRAARSPAAGDGWTVVIDPSRDDPGEVRALAEQADGGMRIALVETYAGNPLVNAFGEAVRFDVSMADMQSVTTDSLEDAALGQIRLARAVGVRDLSPLSAVVTEASALMTLQANFAASAFGLTVLAMRTAGAAPGQRMTLYGAEEVAHLALWNARNARPGEAELVDASGSRRLPTLYETAHRAALRAMASRTWGGGADLRAFAADIALVESLFRG